MTPEKSLIPDLSGLRAVRALEFLQYLTFRVIPAKAGIQ
jgi:hypothetical protein